MSAQPSWWPTAERLVRHRRWRWLGGMRPRHRDHAEGYRYAVFGGRISDFPGAPVDLHPDWWVPDLSDAATVGVLLADLPVGWSCDSPRCDGVGTYATVIDGDTVTHRGSLLGEAVALALLDSWGGAQEVTP